jgi:hypothetical protein
MKSSSSISTEHKSIESVVELAEKALALKKWEEAVQQYSQALELMSVRGASSKQVAH